MSKTKKTVKFDTETVLKNMSAFMALMDTVKNAPLAKGVNTADVLEKSLSNWPDSAIENTIDGEKLIQKTLPEWSKKNPALAKTAGFVWDVADPSLLIPGGAASKVAKMATKRGATKVATSADKAKAVIDTLDKVLNPGGVAISAAGKATSNLVANKAARKFIKKNITKSAVRPNSDSVIDEAEKLAKYAKEKGYNLNINKAAKLRDIIEGSLKEVDGTLQRGGGIKDQLGKEVEKVLDSAIVKNAPKVDRTKITNSLREAVEKANKDINKAGRRDLDALMSELDDIIKPVKRKEVKIPPLKVDSPKIPKIPTQEVDSKLAKLQREIEAFKPRAGEGKTLDDILSEMKAARVEKGNLEKSNKDIVLENKNSKSINIPGTTIVEETPIISDVKSLWELRKSMAKELSELNLNKAPSDITVNKAKVMREAMIKVEDAIQEALSKIPGAEGKSLNDAYKAAKKDYSETEDFTRFLRELEYAQNKGGPYVPATVRGALATGVEKTIGSEGQLNAARLLNSAAESPRNTLPRVTSQLGQEAVDLGAQISGDFIQSGEDLPLVEESQLVPPSSGRKPNSVEDEISSLPEIPEEEIAPAQNVESDVPLNSIEQKIENTLNPKPLTFNPYINEEILNTPLPRNSDRLLKNPAVLKAKLSQAAPQYLPVLEDMMQNDPEGLKKAAPMIANMVPSIFERDDYNAFDGKIFDPLMQQKFMTDLKRDESLGAIEKAQLAIKVRRGEPI
jgi:hypothetical protein